MRPFIMPEERARRVKSFLEKVDRRREEEAMLFVDKWIKGKARKSYEKHRGKSDNTMAYYEKMWEEILRRKALENIAPKVNMEKVSKFINSRGIPKCVNDILDCYMPSVVNRPSAHYPIHWSRDFAMELFSSHVCGYEGDWFAQRKYY